MKQENEERAVIERKKGQQHGVRTQQMVSFRCDLDVLEYLKSQPNKGRYLNDLVRAAMGGE